MAAPGDGSHVVYQLVPTGPPLDPVEVETAEQTVEVVVMWGDFSILHVAHVPPTRSFYVGDGQGTDGEPAVDYLIGSDSIGAARLPVTVPRGQGVAVVLPAGATGDVTVDEVMTPLSQLAADGLLAPCDELPGATCYPLAAGATARVHHRGFTFVVRPMHAARDLGAGGPGFDWRSHLWTGASVLFHVALLAAFYFLPPTGSGLSLELLQSDEHFSRYAVQPPEVQLDKAPDWIADPKDEAQGGSGERHADDVGKAGDDSADKTEDRLAVQGPADNPEPQLPKRMSAQDVADRSIIGVLMASARAWNAPTSPYGADAAQGADLTNAIGAIMGAQIGANAGFGGLGMRGTGHGGGGNGEGTVGLGTLGTIGRGAKGGTGDGYGAGAGGPMGVRDAHVPRIRTQSAKVVGSLSKEVIRRVIRRHLAEVRHCYEQALIQRPDLAGRVAVQFIITPDGKVGAAAVTRSTMAEPRVGQCIATAVKRWSFPAPEGGLVNVTYPFVLEQAGG